MKKLTIFIFLFTVALVCGCKSYWDRIFDGPPIISVTDSSLNWLTIQYCAAPGEDEMFIEMRDRGTVKIKSGHSSLVNNSFAHNYDAKNWRDLSVKVCTLSPLTFVNSLQSLVNAGLLKYHEEPEDDMLMPRQSILVKGNLENRKISRYVFDPDLIREIESQIRFFNRNVPNL